MITSRVATSPAVFRSVMTTLISNKMPGLRLSSAAWLCLHLLTSTVKLGDALAFYVCLFVYRPVRG